MGLLAPAALAFAALFVPVLVMYFIQQRREPVVLPTIILWARFLKEQSEAARFRRFRSSLLFWLQVAVLAALILSLARPFRPGGRAPGQATVVVLDVSASMQSVEDGESRFERAKAEIADTITALGGGDRMMLVAAGPRPWVVQGLTDDARAFRRALRALRCTDGPGDLAAALRMGAQAAGPGAPPSLQVWTDGAGRALDGAPDLRVPIEWHAVGETSANVAATALAVRRRPDSPLDLEVFTSVANLGPDAQDVAVSLMLDDALLSYGRYRLAAGAVQILTEPLLAGRRGIVRVRVTPEDALAVDNTAALVLAERLEARVLLVSPGSSLLERVLRVLPGVRLTVAAPGPAPSAWAAADLVVYDRWVPASWPAAPALVFGPPDGAVFASARPVGGPALASWRRDHPLLRFLTFADVQVSRAVVHAAGAGVTPLVSATDGALVWVQRAGGARQVVVGFPLEESDWILRPSFPLFLANVLESVRGTTAAQAGRAAPVGDSLRVRLPAGVSEATVEYPDGTTLAAAPRSGMVSVDDTWQAGLYRFQGSGWSELRAVNLLDPDESRIAPQALPAATAAAVRQAGFRVTREYWPWLVFAAVLLSMLEWAVFHRRTA